MTTDNRFVQFNKTKMCKFEVLGRCKKGCECPFAHSARELNALPNLHCTKLCKSLILSGICADENCNYAHSKDELRSIGTFHKTKMCRFMQTGHCALGAKCNFAHSGSELRSIDGSPESVSLSSEGMVAPPGLGWDNLYAGTRAVNSDVADLSALAQVLDVMLSQQKSSQDAIVEAPEFLNDTTIQSGSPAYVRLGSAPKASRDDEGNGALGTLSFNYLNAEIQSMSTRSPKSPATSPSPSGSHSSSSKSSSGKSAKTMSALGSGYKGQEPVMPVYFPEGAWESPLHGAGMGGFGPTWSFGAGTSAGMDHNWEAVMLAWQMGEPGTNTFEPSCVKPQFDSYMHRNT